LTAAPRLRNLAVLGAHIVFDTSGFSEMLDKIIQRISFRALAQSLKSSIEEFDKPSLLLY
jgi:hypothetical protein